MSSRQHVSVVDQYTAALVSQTTGAYDKNKHMSYIVETKSYELMVNFPLF